MVGNAWAMLGDDVLNSVRLEPTCSEYSIPVVVLDGIRPFVKQPLPILRSLEIGDFLWSYEARQIQLYGAVLLRRANIERIRSRKLPQRRDLSCWKCHSRPDNRRNCRTPNVDHQENLLSAPRSSPIDASTHVGGHPESYLDHRNYGKLHPEVSLLTHNYYCGKQSAGRYPAHRSSHFDKKLR